MSDFQTIAVDIDDGILTLTLNRPDQLNAFNKVMMREMIAAFDIADGDDAVRAVIVTGAGRAYCAGADLGAGGATFDYGEASNWAMPDCRSAPMAVLIMIMKAYATPAAGPRCASSIAASR